MIGRWFGKSKKRIGAEELGQLLAEMAQPSEGSIPSGWEELETEYSPLGISLVQASAVAFAWHARGLLQRLPPERFETLRETYYEKAWEGIVSRFGAQKAQYDEFVRHLGGGILIVPESIRTDFTRRVHDVLGEAVELICPAANEFLAASDSDKGAAGIALGKAVGRVLFGGRTDLDVARVMRAYCVFMATAKAVTEILHELERDGLQVF